MDTMHGEQIDPMIGRPEVLAFLRAIKANPDDNTPRLILADWLEEHGDAMQAARGEFLRLQCLGSQIAGRERQAELLRCYETAWLGSMGPLVRLRSFCWDRGLLHFETTADILLDRSVGDIATDAFAWVEGITLRRLTADWMYQLIAVPWMRWLNQLDLNFNALGDFGAWDLTSSPNLVNLRTLWLRGNDIGPEGAATLAQTSSLPNLKQLSLRDNSIGEAGASALANSPLLTRLTFLNLQGNHLGGSAVAELTRAARVHPQLWLHIGEQRRF